MALKKSNEAMFRRPHPTPQFSTAMQQAHKMVLDMGKLVERQLKSALEAMHAEDVEKAKQVMAADDEVNRMEILTDEACTVVLARYKPVAGDLRMVIVLLKTITDLERIGDEAQHIAEQVSVLSSGVPQKILDDMGSLSDKVAFSLACVIKNFARLSMNKQTVDVAQSHDLVAEDRTINKQADELIAQTIGTGSPNQLGGNQKLALIWYVRALERIGDHVKNISQYLIYYVEGEDIRHTA